MDKYTTRDISLASYLRLRGYKLIEYRIIDNKLSEWMFDIGNDAIQLLKKDYVNSEIAEFEGIRRGMAKQKYE